MDTDSDCSVLSKDIWFVLSKTLNQLGCPACDRRTKTHFRAEFAKILHKELMQARACLGSTQYFLFHRGFVNMILSIICKRIKFFTLAIFSESVES